MRQNSGGPACVSASVTAAKSVRVAARAVPLGARQKFVSRNGMRDRLLCINAARRHAGGPRLDVADRIDWMTNADGVGGCRAVLELKKFNWDMCLKYV